MVMRNVNKHRRINICLEAVAFQNDNFGKTLAALVEDIRESGILTVKELTNQKFNQRFSDIVKEYTNLEVPFYFVDTISNLAVVYNIRQVSHPLDAGGAKISPTADKVEAVIETLQKENDRTYVDLATGKVYGNFVKSGIALGINVDLLLGSRRKFDILTPDELAASILHEIGHLLTYCEYTQRFSLTNVILATMARSIQKNDPVKRKAIYTSLAKLVDLPSNAFDEVAESDDFGSVAPTVIDKCLELPSQLGSGKYDYVSAEALADNYVTRCGYGRHLLNVLAKSGRPTDDYRNYDGKPYHFPMYALSASIIIGGIVGLFSVFSAVAGAACVYSAYSILTGGATTYDYTYDTLKVRMKRIREVMVEKLKDSELPAAEKKTVLNDLEKADFLINQTADAKHKIFDRIADYLFKSNRSLKNQIKLQRELEEIASNDLFIKAAQLSTL